MLPYSINEIYGIKNKSGNRYQNTKRLYAEFYPLCNKDVNAIDSPDLVVVEDSNSGYEFFREIFSAYNIKCISAGSKSNIYNCLIKQNYLTALVIADGAAFGSEIEKLIQLSKIKRVIIYLPESFEWLILESGLIKNADIPEILSAPYDYIESEKFFSWERFFTDLLQRTTNDTYLKYTKKKLNKAYLNDNEKNAIINVMPKIITK